MKHSVRMNIVVRVPIATVIAPAVAAGPARTSAQPVTLTVGDISVSEASPALVAGTATDIFSFPGAETTIAFREGRIRGDGRRAGQGEANTAGGRPLLDALLRS